MRATLMPELTQNLVTKAFTLEAITDKPGCTSRYTDLDGKPLKDFVIAGINSAGYFALLAADLEKDPASPIFGYNLDALRASNTHKSPKYINFGLLEIMFATVYTRLKCADSSVVVGEIIECVKASSNTDVRHILDTRALAWSTSNKHHKAGFVTDKYEGLLSVWDFYNAMRKDFGPESSHHQWAEQYQTGLPILGAFFDAYTKAGEVIKTTKHVFEAQKSANPAVAVGILADMCAAAIFLWLSFNDTPA